MEAIPSTTEDISKEWLQEVLVSFLGVCEKDKSNVTVTSFSTEEGSSKGDNYQSTMVAVTVHAEVKGNPRTFEWMVKLLPNTIFKSHVVQNRTFEREINVYAEILSDLRKYAERRGSEIKPSTPQFVYGQYKEDGSAVLILENLKSKGFKMNDKVHGLDFNHAKCALTELAKFHALSLSLKQELQIPYGEKYPYLNTYEISPEKPEAKLQYYSSFLDSCLNGCIGLLKRHPGKEESIKRVERVKDKAFHWLMSAFEPKEPMSVIRHGDFWNNNIMFQYKEEGGELEVVKAMMVDWQMVRYGHLALDLAYFFLTSTSRDLRRQHQVTLLTHYLNVLNDTLTSLGSGSDKFTYDIEDFLHDFHESLKFGFVMCCIALPVMFSVQCEDLGDANIKPETRFSYLFKNIIEIEGNVEIEKRLIDIVEELVELGVL